MPPLPQIPAGDSTAGDSTAGDTKGQGLKGVWHAVSPKGTKITASAAGDGS
ncbi:MULTISPECIES: hypothetical protein [unclassified Streptomyces]|uniref:hypothetical protein n=1 Tax=unclassified Streptomyces TaxID=2593676 RepID=UPI0036E54F27